MIPEQEQEQEQEEEEEYTWLLGWDYNYLICLLCFSDWILMDKKSLLAHEISTIGFWDQE